MFGDRMVIELNSFICNNNIGNKAKSLVDLNRYGFKVPRSIALDTNEYKKILKDNKEKINFLLDKLNKDNIEIIVKQINNLMDKVHIEDSVINDISKFVSNEDNYIIRSSIDGVDAKYSFAGIFPNSIIDKNNIEYSLVEYYKHMYSYNSLAYMLKNNIDAKKVSMAVIIQKEIPAATDVFISTLNPITLNTSELKIEVTKDKISEQYNYDYLSNEYIKEDDFELVTRRQLQEIIDITTNLQIKYGYPIEIGLAIKKNNIYILQVKEIPSVLYDNQDIVWNKIDMSSKNFMWGLVRNVMEEEVEQYYNYFKLKNNNYPLTKLEFNSIYLNVLKIRDILINVIDYNQEYFKYLFALDKDIYKSNKKRLIIKRLLRSNKLKQFIKDKTIYYDTIIKQFKDKYTDYCRQMSKTGAKDIEKVWLRLVLHDYKVVYAIYFNYAVASMIEKNLLYNKLANYLSIEEFEIVTKPNLQLSDIKIEQEFNNLVALIKEDEDAYRYWFSSSTLKLLSNYENESEKYYHPKFRKFIDNYGYLSYFNMDIEKPSYVEDVEEVIRELKKRLANNEDIKDNIDDIENILEKLSTKFKNNKYKQLEQEIKNIQERNINLSNLRDYVYKFNFIVKRYTKLLAKLYLTKNIIESENDIWYLDIKDIYDYTEGEYSGEAIKKIVSQNKLYYNAYRNFNSIKTMGREKKRMYNFDYQGIGYSSGIIEGRVRMIKSLKELDTLTEEDILVTKTINNNLFFKLPKIKGLIISDLTLSSSTAAIIRELNIPCLLIERTSKKLKDGMYIKADCQTGAIKIIKAIR